MLVSLVSSMSKSVMTWKGFGRLGSSNTESCAWFSRRFFGEGGGGGERLLGTRRVLEGSVYCKLYTSGRGAFIRYEAFI